MAISSIFTDLLVLRFMLASAVCVAAGLGAWSAMALCRRWLPGIAAQRSVWLLAQCTIVTAFALMLLLPQASRLRLLPPIDIEDFSAGHGATSASVAPANASSPPARDAAPAIRPWLVWSAQGWLLVYAAGLAFAVTGWAQGHRALHRLAAAGTVKRSAGVALIEVAAPISPMLFGLITPRLLLPLHLRAFDTTQRQLIVAHELTHLRRRDLHWASASLLLQTLFWFNPFMRSLRQQLCWAQELGCDRDVLRGRPTAQRKAYAAALLAQLKLQQQPLHTALAFGTAHANSIASMGGRIALIRNPSGAARSRWSRGIAGASLLAILAASLALQPSLASHTALTPYACTAMSDAASGRVLRREGRCDEPVTPASTFNIVVALMGYDSGILIDEHTPKMAYQTSYTSWNEDWRRDTDPSDWIKYSNVWYAQQVTAGLGAQRFQRYVDSFGYGNRDLAGDAGKDNGLALSWISSSLKISASGQVDFLRKIVNRQLPVSAQAYAMTARILHPQTLDNGWTIYAKTGTASPVLPNGRDDDQHQYGWYVGWASKGGRNIVFARMVLEDRQQEYAGARVKRAFLRELATQLDTL